MQKLKSDHKSLRKFGMTMGIVFLAIAILIFMKHKQNPNLMFIVSVIFFLTGFVFPALLKPVYIGWMKLAFILSWINTRILLVIIFYLIFTPVGLIIRLFRVDLLERAIDRKNDSYWRKKDKKGSSIEDYEHQF